MFIDIFMRFLKFFFENFSEQILINFKIWRGWFADSLRLFVLSERAFKTDIRVIFFNKFLSFFYGKKFDSKWGINGGCAIGKVLAAIRKNSDFIKGIFVIFIYMRDVLGSIFDALSDFIVDLQWISKSSP